MSACLQAYSCIQLLLFIHCYLFYVVLENKICDISGNLLNMIEDWLKDRRQRVCIKGRWSGWIRVWSGVLC